MADEARESQEVVEIAAKLEIGVRESQEVVEIMAPLPIETRETQQVLENSAIQETFARQTQQVIEIIRGAVDLSGIYFINPKITHDIYYGELPGTKVDKKIPDPTVRISVIGE